MFIQCSDCNYKYLVNSADLKPDGRMVECANCNHRWYQESFYGVKDVFSSSVPKTLQEQSSVTVKDKKIKEEHSSPKQIKNLPSTVVREKKVSLVNTFFVIFILVLVFFLFWVFKSYGTNIFVLLYFYLNEFFFNLNLIIDDLAKIIYKILN